MLQQLHEGPSTTAGANAGGLDHPTLLRSVQQDLHPLLVLIRLQHAPAQVISQGLQALPVGWTRDASRPPAEGRIQLACCCLRPEQHHSVRFEQDLQQVVVTGSGTEWHPSSNKASWLICLQHSR